MKRPKTETKVSGGILMAQSAIVALIAAFISPTWAAYGCSVYFAVVGLLEMFDV